MNVASCRVLKKKQKKNKTARHLWKKPQRRRFLKNKKKKHKKHKGTNTKPGSNVWRWQRRNALKSALREEMVPGRAERDRKRTWRGGGRWGWCCWYTFGSNTKPQPLYKQTTAAGGAGTHDTPQKSSPTDAADETNRPAFSTLSPAIKDVHRF